MAGGGSCEHDQAGSSWKLALWREVCHSYLSHALHAGFWVPTYCVLVLIRTVLLEVRAMMGVFFYRLQNVETPCNPSHA